MQTIDTKLHYYVWENISTLNTLFSEKVYQALLNHKNENDEEFFNETLELILDMDNTLKEKIKSLYENIDEMSMEEIIDALEITAYDNFNDKIKYIERAEYFVENYDEEDLEYGSLLNNLALRYQNINIYANSELFYLKSIKIYEKNLGKNHSETATLYNNLAMFYHLMGEYEKAEIFYLKSIKIKKESLGENHSEIATLYNNLAGLYLSREDYDQAKSLYLKGLRISENTLGENHPNTASSYNNLAEFYRRMGEHEKAEQFYFKAINIHEKILDINHPNRQSLYKNFNKLLNKNFKLKSIEINNFKQYSNPFRINFSKQINILIGQNAIGKTTLLQAITLGLLKENSPDEETSYTKYITKGKEKANVEVLYSNGRERKVEILKDRREIGNGYYRPFVLSYCSSFFTDYIESDPIVQQMLAEKIEENFANSIFVEHTNKFWNPISILRNLSMSEHEKAKEKKKIIIDTINQFINIDGYTLIASNAQETSYHFTKGKTSLDLSELSEGYRSNILLITDMLIKILGVGLTPSTVNAVVLIDEFDKHLHPKWQSNLINQLKKSFPHIQFILTTHNPMSILDRKADEINVLKEVDGVIVAEKRGGTENIDVSIILLEYFNVKSTIGESMQQKINDFNRLKLQKTLSLEEVEELKELEKYLSTTIASNFIYDKKYLRFLEYIKEHKEIDFNKYVELDEERMKELLEDFGDFFDD